MPSVVGPHNHLTVERLQRVGTEVLEPVRERQGAERRQVGFGVGEPCLVATARDWPASIPVTTSPQSGAFWSQLSKVV